MKTINKRTKPSITNKTKKLTKQQLELVEVIYKFRFVTSSLVSEKYGRQSKAVMHRRLQLLQQQGILGMYYDGYMRLRGQPGSYYLLAQGIAALKAQSNSAHVSTRTLRAAYKDRTAKATFIHRSLVIFQLYNQFRRLYGANISFSTKSNLTFEAFDYFPQPLPDGFIRLKRSGTTTYYFLEYIDSHTTTVGMYKLVKKYSDYFENEEWSSRREGTPAVILVCETDFIYKAIRRLVAASDAENDMFIVLLNDRPEKALI